MATFGDIGVSQPAASTITMKVGTVTINRNSTVAHQELLTLAGAESSLEIVRVLAATPASTDYGLVVREVVPQSTTVNVSSLAGAVIVRSSAANALVSVYQSTAADLNVTVAGYSTTVNVSSLAGIVVVSPVSTASVRVHQSTAGDLNVTVAGYVAPSTTITVSRVLDSSGGGVVFGDSANNALRVNVVAGAAGGSTIVTVSRVVGNSSAADYVPVRIVDSSGTGFLAPGLEYTDGSTTSTLAAPGLAYRNSSNDTMRVAGLSTPFPVQIVKSTPTRASVSSTITSTASTALYTLISSAATARCVYAYSVTSTAVAPMAVEFLSSGDVVIWGVDVGSASSGVTGANLAVAPPGALFQSVVNAAVNVRLGSTGVQVRVSAAYFSEP